MSQAPRQCDLCGSGVLRREFLDRVNQGLIGLAIFRVEARNLVAEILVVEFGVGS